MALHDPFWYRCGFVGMVAEQDDDLDMPRTIDGDTIILDVRLGFFLSAVLRIRLLDVNTPEIRGTTGEVHARALAASAYTKDWFTRLAAENPAYQGHPFWLRTEKGQTFNRWLGRIESASGRSLNMDLLTDGHANPEKTPRGTW